MLRSQHLAATHFFFNPLLFIPEGQAFLPTKILSQAIFILVNTGCLEHSLGKIKITLNEEAENEIT